MTVQSALVRRDKPTSVVERKPTLDLCPPFVVEPLQTLSLFKQMLQMLSGPYTGLRYRTTRKLSQPCPRCPSRPALDINASHSWVPTSRTS